MAVFEVAQGILIPFLGTVLGAACVFFTRKMIGENLGRALTGFAAGVMVAAAFFSLLVPAIDQSAELGKLAFIPAVVGFLIGILFFLLLDKVVPHIHLDRSEEGMRSGLKRTTKLILAVSIHNLPEGMAAGIVYAGWLYSGANTSPAGALALSLGIALQNFPEGAIVSMPLRAEGMPRWKTFLLGALSGIVEPIGALLTIFAAGLFLPVLPYLLSFAAGAMFYVVVDELVPEMSGGGHSNIGTACFAVGFVLMTALDVGLG